MISKRKAARLLCASLAVASASGAGPAGAASVEFLTKLTAPGGAADDQFGISVALSGTTAIVGAQGRNASTGAAYLFDAATGEHRATLTATDGSAGDDFGYTVGLDGTTALVSARGSAEGRGAAYLFDTATQAQFGKLTADDGAPGDRFGNSVALDGGVAAVGAVGDDRFRGSAYLFDVDTATQLRKLQADDGRREDAFASFVAIEGDNVLVGSRLDDDNGPNSGSAYLFDATTGAQRSKLTASDGRGIDEFARYVALEGDTALIGARRDNDDGYESGSAYLFDIADPLPARTERLKLTAPDAQTGDRFGRSVTLDGDLALIGAFRDDDNGVDGGSAYLFDATTGDMLSKILAPDGAADDEFGYYVSIAGDLLLIGAPFHDVAGRSDQGAAYLFRVNDAVVPLPASAWFSLLGLGAIALVGLGRRTA
ncbi:MAG: FG-GAP repeat protein [Paracoccaceae bacterium]